MNGRPRRRLCAEIRAEQPNCRMCGHPIDVTIPRRCLKGQRANPLRSVVDEWLPRALGGDPRDKTNLAHCHAVCNGIKGAKWPITLELMTECRRRVDLHLSGPTRRRW